MPAISNKFTVKGVSDDTRQTLCGRSVAAQFGLLTTKDAARVLGLRPSMLERLRWMGEGPPFVRPTGYGRAIRYSWQDLLDWIERNRVDPEKARRESAEVHLR